ncbi:MAG: beta-lactamase family protein [Megasphaera sp.]|uniref:serine hydrolase domain-containing protein n=1 Tax=Megasphaera sueciensis TaxID=349094 RepID=UPI003D0549FC|nr:beta-lactamase family protein [Megasphaera sp.]MCI1822583.1 beta-lactamase family protein [Megasphaera sp.]
MNERKILTRKQIRGLDRDLESLIGDTGLGVPGLAVVIYKNGEQVYEKFLGRRYINGVQPQFDLPVTKDSRFRVASVSKQFTALTILQLAEAGKLSLEEDICKYLGFTLRHPRYPEQPITIRMLLSHISSLCDGSIYAISPDEDIIELFMPEGLYYRGGEHFSAIGGPGTYFHYCNLNYGLLGTIIEVVTGVRFDMYQRTHILKELNISGSYNISDFDTEDMKRLGTVYQKQKAGRWDENGPWYPQIDDYRGIVQPRHIVRICNPDQRQNDDFYNVAGYVPGTNGTIFSPQGGLRISAQELTNLLDMYLHNGVYQGKQIVTEAVLKEMFSCQWYYDRQCPNGDTCGGTLETYGLGVYRMLSDGTSRPVSDRCIDLVGHTGEAYGLLSAIMIFPGTGNGFLYIMNGEAIAEEDMRARGIYSGNYRWEERMMTAIIQKAF